MNELSIFIDESGDFGKFNQACPYYIVALVLHEQKKGISVSIQRLNRSLADIDAPANAIHTAPLIRREGDYLNQDVAERQAIFNRLFYFTKNLPVTYRSLCVDKRHLVEPIDLCDKLSQQLSFFLNENRERFAAYNSVVIYYDNGQIELTKVLVSVFRSVLNNVIFRRILPVDYKIAQVADMICTVELLALKSAAKDFSRSETAFFGSPKEFEKSFLRAIRKKLF